MPIVGVQEQITFKNKIKLYKIELLKKNGSKEEWNQVKIHLHSNN